MLTVKEVVKIVGVGLITMRRWIEAGYGPLHHLTPMGNYPLAEADVLAWLESMKQEPKQFAPEVMAPVRGQP